MAITIAARQSGLARIQAELVGQALQAAHPGLSVAYHFRASLGDQRADEPLWQMPEKGVFTADFRSGLLNGEFDLVVHSWKDLPLETDGKTEVVATLPRGDQRDVLLIRRDRWEQRKDADEFTLLTSSPRRAFNLAQCLPPALPKPLSKIRFEPVRGNIQTRVAKLWQPLSDGSQPDSLIVAKAALDRLLAASDELRASLSQCRWMVLPLSVNPTAPAQGALAIEIASMRKDLRELCQAVNCEATFAAVTREREILAAHGGGCHLPLGASVLHRPYGQIEFVCGAAADGTTINESRLIPMRARPPRMPRAQLWPLSNEENEWFTREALTDFDETPLRQADAWWIAKAEAWPSEVVEQDGILFYSARNQIPSRFTSETVWTGGWKTWQRLAQSGVWVNGCTDGLGESEAPMIDLLAGKQLQSCKLTHAEAESLLLEHSMPTVATYRLVARESTPDLTGREMFFWTSGSNFLRALALHPWLKGKAHACGPGHTQQVIERAGLPPHIFLSRAAWLREMAED
ncbi:MAG: hydroxymethylbilane synthase [Acidobacteria bacterium]|nr:hydroxymethylbilane synthase [Acidobacteriota bacterium]